MNIIIDYLLKRGWQLAIIVLLLAIIGLMYIALQHKDVMIAGLKVQNMRQDIVIKQSQAIAAEEKRIADANGKKADEYHILADTQLAEIQRQEVPQDCEKAKDWLIESLAD